MIFGKDRRDGSPAFCGNVAGDATVPANQAGMLRRDAAHVVNVIARRKRAVRTRRIGKNEVSLLWLRTSFARGCSFA
jgi:hypothetical protein